MWEKGMICVNNLWYRYQVKFYKKPSKYGINKGKISKLHVSYNSETIINYDREWDIRPSDHDAKYVLKTLLLNYN